MSPGMLREVRTAARAGGYVVSTAVASAERLPFGDATFDRVIASHMLYHVPDQRRALEEMRRVARNGGRVVLATNGGTNGTYDLHCVAARAVGFMPTPNDAARFTLEDLALVRSIFPSAEVFVREDALLFPDAAAVLRYYASYPVDEIEGRPLDGSHRAPLIERMGRHVSEIIARDGVLRLPKTAGCFVATV
jgi:SAM-dependent methyltransferase